MRRPLHFILPLLAAAALVAAGCGSDSGSSGSSGSSSGSTGKSTPAAKKIKVGLVTDINLVEGDITRIISEKLLGPEFADLRSAHQESVKQAQDIVERNVNILISIVKEIGDELNKHQGPAGP